MRPLVLALICGLLPVGASAQLYRAENWLTVAPLNATEFEVIESNGEGPRGIWCAAASFVEATRPAAAAGRLYVKSPRGPSVSGAGRIGVVFTTQPESLNTPPVTSYSLSVRVPGLSLPVIHAYQFCQDFIIEQRDRL